MRFSYSRLSCFANCPYQYKLRYIDKLKTIPSQDPVNALYLGTAIHAAFETGSVDSAIMGYRSNYNVLTDLHINEELKLEHLVPKVLSLLPDGECEVCIQTDDFIGFIDRLVKTAVDSFGITHYEIWDYKYSNNIDNYVKSPQLSLYKYYFEKTHPNTIVDHLKYVFVPKINIRQKTKSGETLQMFRDRLKAELEKSEIKIVEVDYDGDSVTQFERSCQQLNLVKTFPKNPSRLCDWCEYKAYCESDGTVDWMILPKE